MNRLFIDEKGRDIVACARHRPIYAVMVNLGDLAAAALGECFECVHESFQKHRVEFCGLCGHTHDPDIMLWPYCCHECMDAAEEWERAEARKRVYEMEATR